MGSVRIHAVIYTAVNAMLVAIWAVTGGSMTSFWPIWPIITWGAALVIHGGVIAGLGSPGGRVLTGERHPELDEAEPPETESWDRPVPTAARRRWVAVMFVDIVGSTGLNESLGDDAWHRILAEHRSLVRTAVRSCRGVEVGTAGDGALARFDSPSDAVACAVGIQREIEDLNGDAQFAPEVRIGIHAGEAVAADRDLLGRVVNLASRVADEAGPGEILVTETVADELGSDLTVEDRGLRPLKGLDRPRHLLAVQWSAGIAPSG